MLQFDGNLVASEKPMNRCAVLLLLLSTFAVAQRPVHVRSTTTRNGEYRQAHVRTSPNRTRSDNYSAKGNVNPYTGKRGTKKAMK